MTKAEFIAKYQNRITVYFDFEELITEPSIAIKEGNKSLSDFLDFYIPRYAKNGVWNNRSIRQIIQDKDSVLVQLKDIIKAPETWDLAPFHNAEELKNQLWPIPIATDCVTGKTLILDSNHTICTLLINGINMNVPYLELVGKDISALGVDLQLMNK